MGDEIGDAAKQLAAASYPFAKEVDWNNGLYLQAPGAFQPLEALKAIDKMIVLGSQADPKLLKAAADAHHKAISSASGPTGVFFVVGLAQALVHAAHQCLKPCICSVCRTPGAGAVPLGTVPLSAGRACPPRGASSARRE